MSSPHARNLELEARALLDLDDDARRVYADWLISVGDPRGELINLELHGEQAYRSVRRELADEIAAREAAFRADWDAWASERELEPSHLRLRQGFVIDLGLSLAALDRALSEVFAREPVQRLTITAADDPGFAKLCRAHADALGRLRYLKVQGELGPAATEALATVPLGRLEGLNLLGTSLDADACAGLASLGAPRLTHLTLTANAIVDSGIERLIQNPGRGSWRALYLAGNPIGAGALHALAADRELTALEGLFLAQIEAVFTDFEVLLEPDALPACRRLEISSWGSWRERELLDRLRQRFPKLELR